MMIRMMMMIRMNGDDNEDSDDDDYDDSDDGDEDMMNDDDIIHRLSIIFPHMYKSSSILTYIAYLRSPWSMCSSSTPTKRTRGSQPGLSYHIISKHSISK